VALVRTDVSEEFSASIISVTRIGDLETTLAVTRHAAKKYQSHGETYQKTAFVVTAVKTSNLTKIYSLSDFHEFKKHDFSFTA
jgi:hypothetical protein